MMYFAWGYILATSFLNYSNYIPLDFFSPIVRKVKVELNLEFNRSSTSFVGGRGNNEAAGLDYVKVVHSDNTESNYYTK